LSIQTASKRPDSTYAAARPRLDAFIYQVLSIDFTQAFQRNASRAYSATI
jgi:hypothetical protein